MKKLWMFALTFAVAVVSFSGFGADAEKENPSRVLIAYFSRVGITDFAEDVDVVSSASLNVGEDGKLTGNCAVAANMVREATGGDMFQIVTTAKYPSEYDDTTDQAAREQDANARPELAALVKNMDDYDTIFLVYPNWWGTLPMPLFTFLSQYDFSGKTILPLCTHEGSGLGGSVDDIESLCPNATLLEGLAIRGGDVNGAQNAVKDWIDGLGMSAASEQP